LFKLLNKYRPESKQEKKARLTAAAASATEEKEKDAKVCSIPRFVISSLHSLLDLSYCLLYEQDPKKPLSVKYGLNRIVVHTGMKYLTRRQR